MSTVLEQPGLPEARHAAWRPWLGVLAGLLLLYVPTYLELARGLWRDDAYAHGPIILAVFAWLVWRNRDALVADGSRTAPVAGATLLAVGLLLYVVGRSQGLALFEVASHIPVITGVLLMMRGPAAVRRLAFPILFLLFLVPLPGFILETVTTPLKSVVSALVESILQLGGYPVTRAGVVLEVGNHQMLVADACSGLNSLYSLFALALLYLHVTGPSSRARKVLLLASIVPIAIAANVVRVLALVLVTYHLGDEAGQGFLHGLAGMMVFVIAMGMLMGVDKLLPQGPRHAAREQAAAGRQPERIASAPSRVSPLVPAFLFSLMLGAAIAAPAMKPVRAEGPVIDLEQIVPATFGDWHIDPEVVPIAPAPDVQAKLDRIYRQIVSRTYVNSQGERMMLTIAHGGDQSDALKAHRQEACYAAQGFVIESLAHGELAAAGRAIPVTRMLAVRGERIEPVTYWFTMGDRVVLGRGERLRVQLASGLAGRIPDGMLVRVSSLSPDAAAAFSAQRSFIGAIFTAMPSAEATRFVGAARS